MNRRDFFSMVTKGSSFRSYRPDKDPRGDLPQRVEAGIEEQTGVLSRQQALHLLRRLSLGPTHQLLNELTGKAPADAVEMLLGPAYDEENPEPMPESPGDWVNNTTENPENADIITKGQIENQWKQEHALLQNWWVALMREETQPAREKLVLFWHGHFTTEFSFDDNFMVPQLLYRQNMMMRRNRLAQLRNFVEDFTLDGAMLYYLGGELNVRGNPNENYARELLELFTVGLGWYSEGEVQTAARVLTGWKASKYNDAPAPRGMYNTYFIPDDHDIGAKELLGGQIAARDDDSNTEILVRRDEIRKLITLIFNLKNDSDRHAVAQFIGDKLYRYFVYSNPAAVDEDFLDQLQDLFLAHDYELRPVIAALFKSAHFFDPSNYGVQIKTPAEFMIGLARQLEASPANIAAAMNSVEQNLFDPRDVSGWDGYRAWISTKTYPLRSQFARGLINDIPDADLVAWAKKFEDFADPLVLTSAVEEFLLPRPVPQARHDFYVEALLDGTPDYEWEGIVNDANPGSAALRLRRLLLTIAKAPDFHLT